LRDEFLTLKFSDHELAARRLLHGADVRQTGIVLFHSALASMDTWRKFPYDLAVVLEQDVHMYDRRGHGHSSPLSAEVRRSDYLEHEARQVPRILDQLGLETAIVIGHSDGGSIALLAAAMWPERVSSVVAIASHVYVEDITLTGIRHVMATATDTALLKRMRKYHGDKTERLYQVWHETWLSPGHREWNLLGYLPKIQCPVLVMQGELDEYGTIEQVNAIVKGVGEKARAVMYPGVGHAVWRDREGDVVREVAGFLSSCYLEKR